MAKKNSTKTATKEALQNSEPKYQTFRQWSGINVTDSSPDLDNGGRPWKNTFGQERQDTMQTDVQPNYLFIQDNICTTSNKTLEKRLPDIELCEPPKTDGSNVYGFDTAPSTKIEFTGVTHLFGQWLYAAFSDNSLWVMSIDSTSSVYRKWHKITVVRPDGNASEIKWTDLYVYLNTFIALGTVSLTSGSISIPYGRLFTSDGATDMSGFPPGWATGISGTSKLEAETDNLPTLTPNGDLTIDEQGDYVGVYTFYYSLTNKFGSTELSTYTTTPCTAYSNLAYVEYTSTNYLTISGTITAANLAAGTDGIDIYFMANESRHPIFIGHANVDQTNGNWKFDWFGALIDVSEWTTASLTAPTENTTLGVNATYVTQVDGRLYFWGCPGALYRLYIGGTAGNELSVAEGVGGAWVDIEPGYGNEIRMVLKYKTYGGSSIVTILCTNSNTSSEKRFNLIESNITVTSDIASYGFMAEEISNVTGCSSYHGGGVWADGMYYLNHYGLMVTTQAMEYNSQLRSASVSAPIEPLFKDKYDFENMYVVCENEIIYMAAVGENNSEEDGVIWCYDIGQKAWYTFTLKDYYSGDYNSNTNPDGRRAILSLMNIDYTQAKRGLGVVQPDLITLIPTFSETSKAIYDTDTPPCFSVFATHELGGSIPSAQTIYLCQLEFNFDWIKGGVLEGDLQNVSTRPQDWYPVDTDYKRGVWESADLMIEVDGVDYYGRRIHTMKLVDLQGAYENDYHVWMRIDQLFRTYHITIVGYADFRLSNIVAKVYTQSRKVNLVYGFDDMQSYMKRHNATANSYIHHYLKNYNNIRDAIVP